MTQADDAKLDALLSEIRDQEIPVSDHLMDRIMSDADSVLAQPRPRVGIAAAKSRPFAWLLDAVGGWPSAGGLAAATVAGIWIGAVPPDAIVQISDGVFGGTVALPVLEGDVLAGLE